MVPPHFHVQLHLVFLLEYFALSVIEHITSPHPILVFLYGTYNFILSSADLRNQQLMVRASICSRHFLHILHIVSELMFHKYGPNGVSFNLQVHSRCTFFS